MSDFPSRSHDPERPQPGADQADPHRPIETDVVPPEPVDPGRAGPESEVAEPAEPDPERLLDPTDGPQEEMAAPSAPPDADADEAERPGSADPPCTPSPEAAEPAHGGEGADSTGAVDAASTASDQQVFPESAPTSDAEPGPEKRLDPAGEPEVELPPAPAHRGERPAPPPDTPDDRDEEDVEADAGGAPATAAEATETDAPPVRPARAPRPRLEEPRVIALINQKGGVGKTTTTANLGAALADLRYRVLLIDLDPQAHLTLHLGVNPDELDSTVYDLLGEEDVSVYEVLLQLKKRLWLLPSDVNLAGIETELAPKMVTGAAQAFLKGKCRTLIDNGPRPDFILLDCPPSLGLLTINALVFATEVIVPMQAHFLALQGLSKLLDTVRMIRQSFNPALRVSGVTLCMHDHQTLLAGEVVADLSEFLDASRDQDVPWRDAQVLRPAVRRNIKLAECPSFGQTIFDYAPNCPGARDYRELAKAVAAQSVHR